MTATETNKIRTLFDICLNSPDEVKAYALGAAQGMNASIALMNQQKKGKKKSETVRTDGTRTAGC